MENRYRADRDLFLSCCAPFRKGFCIVVHISVRKKFEIFRIHGDDGYDQTNDACNGEHQGDASSGACAKPRTNQADTIASRHKGDEKGLRNWTNQKGRQRRSRLLHTVGESEDASLSFLWNNFL